MLFNSFEFLIFLPVVFLLYWLVFDHALSKCKHQLLLQNLFIVIASYIFYGWWDWRFLILIASTTVLSFLSGIGIEKAPTQRGKKAVMIANIVVNLGILGVYKYYDFFATQFAELFGIEPDFLLLHLILPVGISFYTFQALSYSIDVYRKQIPPTHDIVAFTAFLSFFPQLVAGPIERATNLLPQFQRKRTFDYATAVDGMRQILWGFFKKIVVADNCASYVDTVFADISTHSGSTLILAAVLFTFQIYGDFSGYSDIAIGTAKLFGIKLMRNFNYPYFSRNIAEFWRRWHISLTTWFRDYVYIPLGGSRPDTSRLSPNRLIALSPTAYTKCIALRNTFIIFLLSGFWHGANWTFLLWGAYHALLFIPLFLLKKNRKYDHIIGSQKAPDGTTRRKSYPTIAELAQMMLTFILVAFGWVIFRINELSLLRVWLSRIFSEKIVGDLWMPNDLFYIPILIGVAIMLTAEWLNRLQLHALQLDYVKNPWIRRMIYATLIISMFVFASISEKQFVYFQF